MNKFIRKSKNIFLYCGLEKEQYNKIKYLVSEDNHRTVGQFSLATAIAFALVLLTNTIKNQNISNITYAIPVVIFALMFILNKTIAKKYPLISDVMAVLYPALLLFASVYIGISQSTERTTVLLPVFIYASTVFTFRLIYLFIMMIGSEAVYLLIALQTQTGNILIVNVANTLIFCFIGLFVGVTMMKIKYSRFSNAYNNQYLSETDALTGVLNRRSFDEYIEELKIKSKKHEIGVIIFDIDYFKKYNDYYGHAKGDEILINIVKPIQDYIKQYDSCKLFRYGGEEFVIVIDSPEENVFKDIIVDTNQLIYKLNIKREDIEEFSRVTVSVGGAIEIIPNFSGDYVTNADNQLYLGKNASRNDAYYKNTSLLTNEILSLYEDNVSGNFIMNKVLTYLCQDYYDIYSVECKTKRVTVYRSGGKVLGISRVLKNDYDYDSSFRAYIENNIHPLDREMVYKRIDFDTVYSAVKQYGVVTIYYRVLRDDATSFFKIKFIPMGTKDNFDSMICAFLPEALDVSKEQIASILELDELTGIYTRQAFYHYADKYIDAHLNDHFKIVVSDIENYRFINRIYGDVKADALLKYLAKEYSSLKECKIIGRYGNDQFMMLIEDNDNQNNFIDSINSIKEKAPIPYLSIKYGAYTIDNIDEPIKAICDKALVALKNIKHTDDLPISNFDNEFILKQDRIQMIETSFEEALENKEFLVYCQPKYNASTSQICGGEALVRWRRENGELIMPSEFIPIFERTGVINRLDEYVFDYVCKQQKALLDKGFKAYPVSVNVSRNTLYQPKMLEKYIHIVESYGIDKKLVPIEITESWAVENYSIKDFVMSIKDAGFILHLDDFGTGYSSLSSLTTLPIDGVKLDKTLIDNIGTKNGEELLRHTIELAHFLKMEITAEGVENKNQLDLLKNLNCEMIQGYYFSKSIEYAKFIELITKVD